MVASPSVSPAPAGILVVSSSVRAAAGLNSLPSVAVMGMVSVPGKWEMTLVTNLFLCLLPLCSRFYSTPWRNAQMMQQYTCSVPVIITWCKQDGRGILKALNRSSRLHFERRQWLHRVLREHQKLPKNRQKESINIKSNQIVNKELLKSSSSSNLLSPPLMLLLLFCLWPLAKWSKPMVGVSREEVIDRIMAYCGMVREESSFQYSCARAHWTGLTAFQVHCHDDMNPFEL